MLGHTAFRAVVGATMFAHGAQKLFGWFGGPGLQNLAPGFERMGLKPGKRTALLAGVSETGGGALLATGFLTPLGSAAVIGVMSQAIETVHKPKGFFNTDGGYEFPLVLIACATVLAETGPGPISLDRVLGTERRGAPWALAALAAGFAGPKLLERLGREQAASEPPTPAPAPQDGAARQEARETVGSSR